MNTITDLVKEIGITKMIFEIKEQMEQADHKTKFIHCLKEIDEIDYRIYNNSSDRLNGYGIATSVFSHYNLYGNRQLMIVNAYNNIVFIEMYKYKNNQIISFTKYKNLRKYLSDF